MLQFHEVVGLDLAKKALLLLAVDPGLGGVILPAKVGSGKSVLSRAFAALLPEKTPFIELPVGITEDRLLGGFNLEAALKTGRKVIEKGLLAKAHQGILYVDALNLMESGTTAHVIDALSRGAVILEREGMSDKHEAAFSLVGTFNPDEGEVRMGLLDRVGLIVPFAPDVSELARKNVLLAVLEADERDSILTENGEIESDADEAKLLRSLIEMAREEMPKVRIRDEQISGLIQTAMALGIEGNRVDIFSVRAAIASAALSARMEVDDEDLKLAAQLVLMPRATILPSPEQTESPDEKQQQPQAENESDDTPSDQDEEKSEQTPPESSPEEIQELLMDAVETALPDSLLTMPFIAQRKGKTGSRGVSLNNKRGKYVRSEQGELGVGKLALVPTIIAAMPFQKSRKEASLRASKGSLERRVYVEKGDIRIKKFRDKAGTLFIFIVDASGSMALNRMRQAKGAVAHLLQNAYIHRDQVALIAFRGKTAEVLLPPSQSVERAKRELDTLPTGGGTPLASALFHGYLTAKQAQSRGISQTTLVLITDGRGNIPFSITPEQPTKEDILKEIQSIAALVVGERIGAIVVDTQANYLSRGEAATLAKSLNGKYVYLPNAKAEQIAAAALSL